VLAEVAPPCCRDAPAAHPRERAEGVAAEDRLAWEAESGGQRPPEAEATHPQRVAVAVVAAPQTSPATGVAAAAASAAPLQTSPATAVVQAQPAWEQPQKATNLATEAPRPRPATAQRQGRGSWPCRSHADARTASSRR
jgi:hypothetical protein